jgi:ABC-type Na+ transport system ATPase subunit NatA
MTFAEAFAEAEQKLALVGLDSVANDRVSTFSGGMKRRLSVSISAIGKKKKHAVKLFYSLQQKTNNRRPCVDAVR